MLSPMERSRITPRMDGKGPEYYDRELEITNNFAVPISITKMQVSNSGTDDDFCRRYFTTPTFDRRREGDWPRAEKGESWKGLSVRFNFQNDDRIGPSPKKCILSMETDRVGRQSLPLIVYSGELMAEIELPDGGLLSKDCLTSKDGAMVTTSGMPCVNDWIENTAEGSTLRDAILDLQHLMRTKNPRTRACSAEGSDPVESYFRSLLVGPSEIHTLQPIIMPLGVVSAGSIVTRTLLLTNLNHVPVEIVASTFATGNMHIRIGITSSLMTNAIQQMKKDGLEDVIYFLANSPLAQDFLSKLKYKVDITPSVRANGNELRSLFGRQAIVEAVSNTTDFLAADLLLEENQEMDCSSGFMLSTDGTYKEDLFTRKIGKKKWTIPSGGVARFIITLNTPESSMLKNDVTSFVSTGLVFETNHGQAMPIVLTYSVLVGQLQLKPSDNLIAMNNNSAETVQDEGYASKTQIFTRTVQVPLFIREFSSDESLHERDRISLSIESTFSQDIYLSEVKSCNGWFNVRLPFNDLTGRTASAQNNTHVYDSLDVSKLLTIKGRNVTYNPLNSTASIPIGEVHSAMTCSHVTNDKSFSACALEWLEKREQIQPPGCGLSEVEIASKSIARESVESKIKGIKTQAITALRDVVTYLSDRYGGETNSISQLQGVIPHCCAGVVLI